ncbi:hypothetical protein FIM10_19020 [Sphingomonadales bacterium 56]|nr:MULTISPECIES: hypothetical protein [Sphingobium]MBY2930774.1 hypothetical protein [Sphingomonadales bacterium 56]MBY2960855.1 hypothetical protein [Sphingomonadales bacterium 58]
MDQANSHAAADKLRNAGAPLGAVVGALLLDEKLPLAKWLGIVGIVAASIGTTITSRKRANDGAQKREHLLEN